MVAANRCAADFLSQRGQGLFIQHPGLRDDRADNIRKLLEGYAPHLVEHDASTAEGFKRSEEHTSELQSRPHLVCRLLLEKKKNGGGSSTVFHTNSLTRAITTTQIDRSKGQYHFSSCFNTYLGNNYYSYLFLLFIDVSQNP